MINDLLERVTHRQTGAGRWLVRCPAHKDRSPSVSVTELDDGRVLLHCFGGCSVDDVLGAVGLEMDALFPPRPMAGKPVSRPYWSGDVMRALADDLARIVLISGDYARGVEVSPADREVLLAAVGRCSAALTFDERQPVRRKHGLTPSERRHGAQKFERNEMGERRISAPLLQNEGM